MYYAILDFASDGISNTFRYIMWQMIKPLINVLNVLLNALLNGILPFSILSNEWVNAGYKACIILMISILPAKIAWELFYAIMMDADNVDPSKKIFGAIMCFFIAISMQYVIPMVNNISVNASNALMQMEYTGSSGNNKKTMSNQQTNLSKNLVVSVLCSFGGMEKNNTVFSYVTKGKNYMVEHSGDYIWDFSYIGTLVGLVIFVILLGYVSIEIAMRIIMIGFWYIISPLCCLSLTNQQNPQAFNVWKNAIMGAFLVNFAQLFLLQFFMNISSSILNNKATGVANTIASLILYFASFSVVISAPPFIQSMIGGYGAGFLESMNQMKGIWNSIGGGAVMAAGKKVMGRHNDMTGHLTGGVRGKLFGNKNMQGQTVGGAKGAFRSTKQGIKNAGKDIARVALGKKDTNPYTKDKDGNTVANPNYGNRHGGIVGAFMGDKSNVEDGRVGRVPVRDRMTKKIGDTVERGARNFRYAPNRRQSQPNSTQSNSMKNLFSNTYSNKSKKGGKK